MSALHYHFGLACGEIDLNIDFTFLAWGSLLVSLVHVPLLDFSRLIKVRILSAKLDLNGILNSYS